MRKYPVFVECAKWDKRRRRLKKFGLRWNGDGYAGNVASYAYPRLEVFCNKHYLKYKIDNGFGDRGSSYRRDFFAKNPPKLFGRWYFCAYCGRILKKDDLTVDHLWPVDAAKKDIRIQKRLKRHGYKSINDVKNLVPACMDCNMKKGRKISGWILKGQIGRHAIFWKGVYVLKIAICIVVISWLIREGFFGDIMQFI